MSTRSRRDTRAPSNSHEDYLGDLHEESKKRKPAKTDARPRKTAASIDGKPGSLSWILSSEKSPLCQVDMSKIINADTWVCLPPQDRKDLSTLLPAAVYSFFEASLPSYHPSKRGETIHMIAPTMELDGIEVESLSFLNCPYFEAAQVTYQDHLYSGWHGKRHSEDVEKYRTGITEGIIHAPWKDDMWEEEQRREEENETATLTNSSSRPRADIASMVSHGLIGEGDIIAYRRNFPDLKITIDKDLLILSGGLGSITVVAPAQSESHLPLEMLLSNARPPAETTLQQMTIQTLEQLEAVVLDMSAQISKDKWTGGKSWKRFTLWKWKAELQHELEVCGEREINSLVGLRGPREKQGTLFYLRGAYLPRTAI